MEQEEYISRLLQRYVLDECNEEEVKRVIAYFQHATNSNDIPTVEEVLKLLRENGKLRHVISDLSFSEVLKSAKEKDAKYNLEKTPVRFWRSYVSITAVCIGILAGGYFFWQGDNSKDSFLIPTDAITLELEDGTIEVLKEDGTQEVISKNGKVLGKQTGSQISYEGEIAVEKLVYNTLKVPYGKRFDLKLSDGTLVRLNSGTSLKYPIKFVKGQHREVYLTGEAFFDVSKDSLNPFIVNADELDVRVLGTRFNVSSYPEDDRADVVLVEGSVGMNEYTETFDKNSSTILKPGFKGTFEKRNGRIKTEAVITDIYTGWINGELVFRDIAFKNILKKLERHYNVVITNNNKDLAEEVFNASYGKVSLSKVLEDLKLTYGIQYSIDGSNITIN